MSSKKRIDTSTIINELHGASLFFRKEEPAGPTEPATPPPVEAVEVSPHVEPIQEVTLPKSADTVIPRYHDTTEEQAAPGMKRDLYEKALVEKVVAEVKQVGTIAATYRFTQEEKSRLGMTVFNLLSGGVRVSENELVRIALNFLLDCLEEGISKYDASPYAEVVKRLKQPKR